MGCTRSLEFPGDRVRGGRIVASVLRTKMAISSVLPGEATIPCSLVSLQTIRGCERRHLRNVTKGAHLRPIQREACIALVPIGFHVSGQTLWLYRHAALEKSLCAREIFSVGGVRSLRKCIRFRRRYWLCPPCASCWSGRMPADWVDASAAGP